MTSEKQEKKYQTPKALNCPKQSIMQDLSQKYKQVMKIRSICAINFINTF